MKRILIFVALVAILAGCGGKSPTAVVSSVDESLYPDGAEATYMIFMQDSYIGDTVYTFTHDEIDGEKVLRISNKSEYDYTDEQHKLSYSIASEGEVVVSFKDWKPVSSSYSLSWDGDVSWWHKTSSDYGEGIVKWTEETPAGSRSSDVEFVQTFAGEEYLDDDEIIWHAPTLGYEKDKKKLFTFFANRSGLPLQGLIWMGGEHDIEAAGKKYHTWAAGIRANEIVQKLWYDFETGRVVRYEQDNGFMSYPDPASTEAANLETYKATYAMVLKEWKNPEE